MTLLCGIDFSESSWEAVGAAACLASRLNCRLHLLHTLDIGRKDIKTERGHTLEEWAHLRAQRCAERVKSLTTDVELHVASGHPEDTLHKFAKEVDAGLVIIGSDSLRDKHGVALAHNVDCVAERLNVPILVVADATPFVRWACSEEPLRALIASDASSSMDRNLIWLDALGKTGRCEGTLLHVYDEAHEFDRLGLSAPRGDASAKGIVDDVLRRELRRRCDALAPTLSMHIRLQARSSHRAHPLAEAAREEHVALVMTSAATRTRFAWARSASNGALRDMTCAVLCSPPSPNVTQHGLGHLRSALVATDFSELGNQAVQLAESVLSMGGSLHILHVLPQNASKAVDVMDTSAIEQSRAFADATTRLRALIPAAHLGRTQVHVVEAADKAAAICQVGERLNAEVICLGSHGTTGLFDGLLRGSVAQAVLRRSTLPVLFARKPHAATEANPDAASLDAST